MSAVTRITPACAGRRCKYSIICHKGWDHPRVRGEKTANGNYGSEQEGSPPRARGEDGENSDLRRGDGITPACAGRSLAAVGLSSPAGDHPRVRGEKIPLEPPAVTGEGSPPRARGEGDCTADREHRPGITPACAGRSYAEAAVAGYAMDHPRVRGEKAKEFWRAWMQRGSPPRARGEVDLDPLRWELERITPACAGRRRTAGTSPTWRWDHPRVRGEKIAHRDDRYHLIGSPPRARGEVRYSPVKHQAPGITPACAGRRTPMPPATWIAGDHPRVRGEKNPLREEEAQCQGSPPRARGEGGWEAMKVCQFGITPACAGRSWLFCFIDTVKRDHPRVRGEKSMSSARRAHQPGSPPRARGED